MQNTMFSFETIFALRAILTEIGMEVRSAFMNTTPAFDCRVCAAAHCRADVCTGEYGSIVDAVTDEHNRTALLADIGQRRQLILREQAGARTSSMPTSCNRVRPGLTVTGQHGGGESLSLHAADCGVASALMVSEMST